MSHDYEIRKMNVQTSFFMPKIVQKYQIICDGSALVDLCRVLRSVVSSCKSRPLTSDEQDVLCDLYNSISIYKLKHKF